jgi:hypothetical protein
LARRGDRVATKVMWKDHIRTKHVVSVFSPSRVNDTKFKQTHPKKKRQVNLQSAIMMDLWSRWSKKEIKKKKQMAAPNEATPMMMAKSGSEGAAIPGMTTTKVQFKPVSGVS